MPFLPLDSRRRLVVGLAVALTLGLVGAGGSLSASAHDSIESSNPESGEVVTDPLDSVSITFSDQIATFAGAVNAIQVTDAHGLHHESGCVTVAGDVATTAVALGEPGEYTVVWQVASSDGHPVSGTYSFSWMPSQVTMAAPAMDTAPVCGEAWSGAPEVAPDVNGSKGSALEETGAATPTGEEAPAALPEPTMTIMSSLPTEANAGGDLTAPVAIALTVGSLAALAALTVFLVKRVRRGSETRPKA